MLQIQPFWSYKMKDYGIEELITNNNIAENSRHILNAIGTSTASILAADAVGVVAGLNATNLSSVATQKAISDTSVATQKAIGDTSVATQKAIGDASVSGLNATNLSGVSVTKNITDAAVAGINTTNLTSVASQKAISDANVAGLNATNLAGVSVTKSVTDGVVSGLNATNLAAVATQKAISDAALSNALSFGAVNSLVSTIGTANAIAAKDIQISIAQDGNVTRSHEAAHFAALQLDIYKTSEATQKELLKGFALTDYRALEHKAALEAKIDKICCCIERDGEKTRAEIAAQDVRRIASENADLRMQVLLKNNH